MSNMNKSCPTIFVKYDKITNMINIVVSAGKRRGSFEIISKIKRSGEIERFMQLIFKNEEWNRADIILNINLLYSLCQGRYSVSQNENWLDFKDGDEINKYSIRIGDEFASATYFIVENEIQENDECSMYDLCLA